MKVIAAKLMKMKFLKAPVVSSQLSSKLAKNLFFRPSPKKPSSIESILKSPLGRFKIG